MFSLIKANSRNKVSAVEGKLVGCQCSLLEVVVRCYDTDIVHTTIVIEPTKVSSFERRVTQGSTHVHIRIRVTCESPGHRQMDKKVSLGKTGIQYT